MNFPASSTAILIGALVGFSTAHAQEQPALKTAFKDHFLIGAALNDAQFSGRDPAQTQLISQQFNSITAENAMKWGFIHPRPGQFNFGAADRFVEFGVQRDMFVIGHTLVWHNQTPAWVFQEDGKPASREVLLQRMREHITNVVGRYKGRVKGWDVVNEAVEGDGSLRQTQWLKIIGEDYLVNAYKFAHEADPGAELYYNDYALDDAPKRKGALELVKKLQSAGVKLTGVGLQGHYRLDWPKAAQIEETIAAFSKLGLKVMITELDVDVLPYPGEGDSVINSTSYATDPKWNPYTNGLPREMEEKLARRYEEVFNIFTKNRSVSRVTFWGVSDRNSWLNSWPARGRTNYPLLFDRNGQPKAAFKAVLDVAK